MAGHIRARNWAETPLGPIESWSETLVATVNLMLHAPSPTALAWGPEFIFLYNDAAIFAMDGRHPEGLGRPYPEVFSEAWDRVRDGFEACFFRGEATVRDNVYIPILLNGALQDCYWSYSLIPVYEGSVVVGLYDAFRNTTELLVAMQQLRESETRLKLATTAARLGIFVWKPLEDRTTWENDRMFEIFGRTREDGPVDGNTFLNEVVHPDYRDTFRHTVESTLKSGKPFDFEAPIRLPDQTQRWIEVKGQLQSTPGQEAAILGTVRDISHNKQQESTWREASRRLGQLAAIVESSDDVIVSKDLNGIIQSWNAAATRVFGYSSKEIVGKSILTLIPDHLHSDEIIIMNNIRSGRRVEHFDTVRRTKSGQLLDVSVTISPIRDESGQIIGASKILRDISIRRRLEQSLLQAEKIAATGRMAATIAHEINNPLAAVMNLLYLLRPLITDPEGIEYFLAIEGELNRVAHIAKQTLGYYREHAAARNASVAEIVEHAITIYEPRCKVAGIEIRKALLSSRKIVLRRGEMMQIVSNLIMNSIYAMQEGGTLLLSVEDTHEPQDGILLTVQDDGVGITTDDLPRVFEAFFTTRATLGTGIGLFVAKQFVEGHGGHIQLESSQDSKRHGTTVRVFLPATTSYATPDGVEPRL
jgi:PAS domain S-box-containing protein